MVPCNSGDLIDERKEPLHRKDSQPSITHQSGLDSAASSLPEASIPWTFPIKPTSFTAVGAGVCTSGYSNFKLQEAYAHDTAHPASKPTPTESCWTRLQKVVPGQIMMLSNA